MNKIRLGFRFIDSRIWLGGYNYLLNLCAAVKKWNDQIQPVVFCGPHIPQADQQRFQDLLGDDFVVTDVISKQALRKRRAQTLLFGRDKLAEQVFKTNQIDAVFENADFYGRNFSIPCIAWVPDFQHRHMPEMFSKWRFWKREIGIRAQFRSSTRTIMLSSDDARNDCHRFYGVPMERINVVPFAVPFGDLPEETEWRQTVAKYDLPDRYLFLPNQFWKHKNHKVVVQALELVKEQAADVVVVVPGAASNPVCVEVFKDIQTRVADSGLEQNFRLLGKIPYRDLICLLSRCTALINPSFFEGWSTTIEEAKAFGATMILSDLAVHREQVTENGWFFSPNEPQQLADLLIETQDKLKPNRPDAAQLTATSDQRMQVFVDRFVKLAEGSVKAPS